MAHIGPQLSPELARKLQQGGSNSSDNESVDLISKNYLIAENSNLTYGPALPPDLLTASDTIHEVPAPSNVTRRGPSGPKMAGGRNFSDSDDQHIGPSLPEDDPEKEFVKNFVNFKQKEQENAAAMAQRSQKREEWMTNLPSKLKTYGLGARQFSKTATGDKDDGSEWTKDPLNPHKSDKKVKESAKKSSHSHFHEKRDKLLEKEVKKFNEKKHRNESLMDLHHKKRKLETEKEEEKSSNSSKSKERRPFDRDKDLKIVDPAKMSHQRMAQKAAQLSSRFSHSSQQKFL